MKRLFPGQRASNRLSLPRGFALLTIIFGLMIFSALVAGMLYLSSSSTVETVSSSQSINAWNMAESGYRYLATQYLNTLDRNDDGDADEEKSAFLELIDSKRFTIANRGSFTLSVTPFYFSNRSGTTASATNFAVQLPGSTPSGFTMPGTGKIMIGDDDPSSAPPKDYSNGSFDAGAGEFRFRLPSPPIAIKRGTSIYLVLYPNAVQNNLSPGNNLNLTLNTYTGNNFPRRNGSIQIGSEKRLYRYNTATVRGNVLSLANLRHSDGSAFNTSVLTTTPIIFKKFLVLRSHGQVGPEQRTLSFYQAINDSTRQPPPDVITLNTAAALSGNFGRDNTITSSSVETRRFAGGATGAIANVNALSIISRTGGDVNDYKCGAFWYNNTSKINTNWNFTKNLSYDVQVKVSSGYQLRELTQGLAFRARNTGGTGNPNTYLALTFMLYNLPILYMNQISTTGNPAIVAGETIRGETSGATGTVQGTPEVTAGAWAGGNAAAKLRLVNVTGTFINNELLQVSGVRRARSLAGNAYLPAANDFIPNEIKPTFDDFIIPNNSLGPLLLVLWERKSDHSFRWLAYKDITHDLYTRGLQDWPTPYGTCTISCNRYDGQVINDNASLLLRVTEKKEGIIAGLPTVKFNEINVFYGDDSARYTAGRTANSYAYDIMANRRRYPIGSLTAFPTWPPKWLTSWEPAVDYFSHIENPDTRPQFQWDAVNPGVTDIPVLQILHDGTLRLAELVTPELGSYAQPEIGMIGCGNITSANNALSFGDFSLKIGINGHEYGGFSGTSMAWE